MTTQKQKTIRVTNSDTLEYGLDRLLNRGGYNLTLLDHMRAKRVIDPVEHGFLRRTISGRNLSEKQRAWRKRLISKMIHSTDEQDEVKAIVSIFNSN